MLLDKIAVSDIAPANTGVIWIKPVGDNYEQSIFLNGKWVKLDKAKEISGIVSSVNNQTPDSNGNVNITKEHIGLGNVNNTSDTEKVVKGANEDGSGNVISITYETKADATTKQTGLQTAISAIQTTVNNLIGLEGTNFAGFSVDTTEADALSAIPTKYTTDGYTNELVWYLVGDGIDNLKAYSYDGTNTPVLVSSKVYDFTDFSGVAADISTLRQDLDALGHKIEQFDEQINGEAAYNETLDISVTQGVAISNSTRHDLSTPLSKDKTYSITFAGSAVDVIYLYFYDGNNNIVECLWGGSRTATSAGFSDNLTNTVKPSVDVHRWAVYVESSKAISTGTVTFAITKEQGDGIYYGRKQTLKITDEVHKMNSNLVVAHIHSEYPYTTKNQSMAVWDNKCFCFNDTHFDDGFCVVIDATTGEVLYRVTDVPYCVSSTGRGVSHLNNACFTDQYYDVNDTYPLLLLSRGDYASSSNKRGQEMYIMRIVETNGVFEFTHIKTIVAQHKFGTFNPSWCYDAKRKMIWGYILTEDWRWTSWRNQNYRKFTGTNALFKAYDTSYVCVESNAEAAVAANVTITVGSTTRTIAVAQGDTISEVFPYVENEGGTCVINCRQDANAFTGLYYVYSCDANGENKKIVETEALLIGFKAPSLSNSETATISSEEFTSPSYIDVGTFQGGCCANGKMYLPFHDYQTINGHPIPYNGKICLIVDPVSGYIESLIKLVISREPEGCAIYNGELYISHHQGGATDETTTPSFEIYKYSFD